MGATQGKLERVHTCVENYLQRRRRRDALDAVDAVDASRWFRPAQVETRLGRYLAGKHIFLKTGMFGLLVTKLMAFSQPSPVALDLSCAGLTSMRATDADSEPVWRLDWSKRDASHCRGFGRIEKVAARTAKRCI